RLRRVMRRQLSRRRNFLPRRGDVDLGKFEQLLFSDRPATQNFDLAVAHHDNCRFNSVLRWSRIDDQRNSSIEFVENMLRRSRTYVAEPVCAWRGKRLI